MFWSWIATATYESVLLTIVPLYFLDNSSWDNTATSHWAAGSLCLTAIVIICNIKVCCQLMIIAFIFSLDSFDFAAVSRYS